MIGLKIFGISFAIVISVIIISAVVSAIRDKILSCRKKSAEKRKTTENPVAIKNETQIDVKNNIQIKVQSEEEQRMSIAKERFEKHQFLHDYAKSASEYFYKKIESNNNYCNKSILKIRYALSMDVENDYVKATFFDKDGEWSVWDKNPILWFVKDHNMRPLEKSEDCKMLALFLAELVAKNMKEILRAKPIDKKYDIFLEENKIVYTCENAAYLGTSEW